MVGFHGSALRRVEKGVKKEDVFTEISEKLKKSAHERGRGVVSSLFTFRISLTVR